MLMAERSPQWEADRDLERRVSMRKGTSSDGGPCRTWPDRMDRRGGFAQGSSAPTPSTQTTMSPAAIGNEDAQGTLQRGRACDD
jgi:hypothetical protein